MSKRRRRSLSTLGPLHVAGREYVLRVTAGPLVHEGEPSFVVPLECEEEILLAADCPRDRRLPLLMYALMRAWVWATGEPKDTFGWCDLSGTAAQQLLRDLAPHGGPDRLLAMRPARPRRQTPMAANARCQG